MSKLSGLYFITDSKLSKQGIVADVQQVIEEGCRIVQYREKGKETAEMVKEAMQLKQICRQKGALFFVNDRIDVALAVDADGVHLGQEDMPVAMARKLLGHEKIIGTSNRSLEQTKQSIAKGVDYVSVGPVFNTSTKKDAGKPVGTGLVKEAKALSKLPVVAIGGISEQNLALVLEANPDCIAMISALVCSEDVGKAAKRVIERIGAFK